LKRQERIKQASNKIKKPKVDPSQWLNLTYKIAQAKKKEFSLWRRWREKIDTDFLIGKELLQKLKEKKVSPEDAYYLTQLTSTNLQNLRKQLLPLALYLLGGGVMLVLSLVFMNISILSQEEGYRWILWLSLVLCSSVVFGIGWTRRKKFANALMSNSVLAQASAAYGAANVPGKGGSMFEAEQQLQLTRQQIKASNPLKAFKR